jgi:hypothetical protein
MGSRTIRISEKAYTWINKQSVSQSGNKLSSPKIIDTLISIFDDIGDVNIITEESKKIKKRIVEIDIAIEQLKEEKKILTDELLEYKKEENYDEQNEKTDLFEETPTNKLNPTELEKMMKTPLF